MKTWELVETAAAAGVGFRDVDSILAAHEYLHGLKPGRVYVIEGGPGSGKSWLVAGLPVVMTRAEWDLAERNGLKAVFVARWPHALFVTPVEGFGPAVGLVDGTAYVKGGSTPRLIRMVKLSVEQWQAAMACGREERLWSVETGPADRREPSGTDRTDGTDGADGSVELGICSDAEQVSGNGQVPGDPDGRAARACGRGLDSWKWVDHRIDGTFPLDDLEDGPGASTVVAPMPADSVDARTPRQWDFVLGQWVEVPVEQDRGAMIEDLGAGKGGAR